MITLATFPPEPFYGAPTMPSLVRLLPGPKLPRELAAAGMMHPQTIRKHMVSNWDRVFGITSSVGGLPFMVVLINRTDPPGFGPGDQYSYQAARVWSSEDLKEMKAGDPAWRARSKLLWLLFDLLDINPETGINGDLAGPLAIPEVWPEAKIDQIYTHSDYETLRMSVERMRALGPATIRDSKYLNMAQLALFLSTKVARKHLGMESVEFSQETLERYYSLRLPLGYRHIMETDGVPGGIRWQVTAYDTEAASGQSTEGPLEALLDSELVVPSEQFEPWLDRNVEEGKLLYDPEPYDLLNSNPLLWDNAEFEAWGKQMGLDV